MANFIKNIFKKNTKKDEDKIIYNKSYSQYGEDRVLFSLFNDDNIKEIFYVDIGAYHPYLYSNTYLFYENGASGINIDCRPGSMKMFDEIRPRDINLEIAIGSANDKLTYYMYENIEGCNTFDSNLVEYRKYKPTSSIEINQHTLNNVLEKYLSENQEITFIDIDVESKEYDILKDFDFNKYKPRYLLIEFLSQASENKNLELLLKKNNYKKVSKANDTVIYKKVE